MKSQDYWIKKLGMLEHPEGGYFKEVVRSKTMVLLEDERKRAHYSSIYFLLNDKNPSHFHRLKDDELWFYHAGESLSVHVILENGDYVVHKLGLNLDEGEEPQVLVPGGSIFGSTVEVEDGYSFVSCVVSPGFDFEDFELFTQDQLMESYPQHKSIITRLAYKEL